LRHHTLVLFALLSPAVLRAEGTLVIALHAESTVADERTLLLDVADVTGAPAALVQRALALDLGPAPLPQLPRYITRAAIERRLARAGIAPSCIAWKGAPTCLVRRPTTHVSAATLTRLAIAHARRSIPHCRSRWIVEAETRPPGLPVAGAEQGLRFAVCLPHDVRGPGTVHARVTVARGAAIVARATVGLRLRPRHADVVAQVPPSLMPRGAP